jgi:periplasmic divalent cation tolerance protein
MLCIITVDKEETAEKIVDSLLDEHLIACGNIIPNVNSYFYWNNKKQNTNEVIVLLKTDKSKFPDLVKKIKELHPYELPEIIGIPISYGLPEYIKWVEDSVKI